MVDPVKPPPSETPPWSFGAGGSRHYLFAIFAVFLIAVLALFADSRTKGSHTQVGTILVVLMSFAGTLITQLWASEKRQEEARAAIKAAKAAVVATEQVRVDLVAADAHRREVESVVVEKIDRIEEKSERIEKKSEDIHVLVNDKHGLTLRVLAQTSRALADLAAASGEKYIDHLPGLYKAAEAAEQDVRIHERQQDIVDARRNPGPPPV